jgi:hypothetical protein
LLPSDTKQQFAHANYVDFDRFRKLWDEKRTKHPVPEVRGIGAELAWHALRTFVKGMQHEAGSLVDPDYYQYELARDTKSISDQAFRTIFKHVWENWYKPLCDDEGFWDDQDLARAVLNSAENKLSQYVAIFCDEAQDFTTIELELIEQLSIYSERDVPSYLVKNVPFAFAGDPFQTLNPTGFNWNTMQSSFHENIAQQLDPNGEAKLEFNFQELAFNYRSSEHIVKLANLVQLLRAVLLNIKGLMPQHCWTRKTTVSPVWFRRDDASCQSALREQSELVIIVPCQENGELEYVKNDPFLKSLAIKKGEVSRNILSPARAKGLEYDRVLLYGFGDESISRLPELLDHIRDPNTQMPDIEQRLAWEYFLNEFYVAVSRARKRLFIIDSSDSLERFWAFTDLNYQKELLDHYDRNENWDTEDLGGIVRGDDASWSDDRDDPLELARQWQEQGRSQRDPYLLRLAKDNFERAGRPEDAALCEAEQYEYEGEFEKAALLFSKLRQADNACRCYWATKTPSAVVAMAQDFPEIASDPRYICASAVQRDRNSAPQIENVLSALEKVTPTPFPDMPGEMEAWRWFFGLLTQKIAEAIEVSDRQKQDWAPYVERLVDTIKRFELPLGANPDIARLHFLVGNPTAAIEFWNAHCQGQSPDSTGDNWLLRAKSEIEPYPTNIRSFHELHDHEAVLARWAEAGNIVNEETPVNLLFDSATRLADIQAMRTLLPKVNDFQKIIAALKIEDASSLRYLFGGLPVAIVSSLETKGNWAQVVSFISNQSTSDKQLNSAIKKLGVEWSREALIAAAIQVMARSDNLANSDSKSQREVSDFLMQNLVIDKDSKAKQKSSVKAIIDLVDVAVVGAAFERAFRLTYALEFYEQFFLKTHPAYRVLKPNPDQSEFAQRRWILCKHRLANTQSGRGKERHEKEAVEVSKELGISVSQEPEYPDLEPFSEIDVPISLPPEEQTDPPISDETKTESIPNKESKGLTQHQVSANSSLLLDGREVNVNVQTLKKRIILTDAKTENQVTCGPSKVSSEDVEIQDLKDLETEQKWEILEWGITCEIKSGQTETIVRLLFSDGTPILGFEFLHQQKS